MLSHLTLAISSAEGTLSEEIRGPILRRPKISAVFLKHVFLSQCRI